LIYNPNLFNIGTLPAKQQQLKGQSHPEGGNTMYWLSAIYFFVVTIATGMLIDLLVKDWQVDWLEKLVMRFGVGLAAMSVLGVILNLLHIPLDYRVFLGAGLFILIGAIVKNKPFRSIETGKIAPALAQCWKNKKIWYSLFMLVLFMVTVKMYVGGTFKYDYFEDTDPWGYTAVADYIGEAKTFSAPYYSIQYNEPYTQGYQIVMGVLSQTNDSIYWTMKFFSALIISFGVLFMYYFARSFSKNDEIAVLAGFFLFAVPAWVSHFVYSLHYNMTILVVLLYVLAQLMHESGETTAWSGLEISATTKNAGPSKFLTRSEGWMLVGIIVYASMFINHLTSVIHGSIFCFVLIITRILAEKKVDWKTIMVFLGGFLLSLLFFVPALADHWWLTTAKRPPGGIGGIENLFPLTRFIASPSGTVTTVIVFAIIVCVYWSRRYWQQSFEGWLASDHRGITVWLCGLILVLIVLLQPVQIMKILGTADRFSLGINDPYYVLSDFFSARTRNMINSPIGLGFVLMSSVVSSFLLASFQLRKLFTPAKAWVAVSYAWIITAFLLVLGKYFSIAIIPFRAWTFLGLFASLFAAWGIVTVVQSLSKNYWILLGTMVLLVAVVIPTSFTAKWRINTAVWKDITAGTPQSRSLFAWMRNGGIPKNSVVAHLCGNSEFLSGYDMNPPLWNEVFHPKRGVAEPYFVAHPLNITPEAYKVLKNAKVKYVTLGASCLWQAPPPPEEEAAYGAQLRRTMDGYLNDRRLTLVKSTGYELLFKLN
jgi:hypothetical protein